MNKIKQAIERLDGLKEHCESMKIVDECTDYEAYIGAIEIAVEIMKKGD